MIDTKILAAYLPFNLTFKGGGDIWNLHSVGIDGDVVLKNHRHTQVIHAENVGVEYAPLLRSFEKLTDAEKYEFSESFGGFMSTWQNGAKDRHEKANWFFEKHFDVYGLIKAGLAEEMQGV